MAKSKFDWTGPVQVAVVAAIILGANIPMWLHVNTEIREMRNIHNEMMRDFHGRLCAIEAAKEKK